MLATILLGAALILPTVGTTALARVEGGGDFFIPELPCADVNVAPPEARFDDCDQGSTFILTEATRDNADVLVDWQILDEEIPAEEVLLYRGATRDDLSPIALSPAEAESYRDPFALLTGDALWYKAVVITEDDERLEGEPVRVQLLAPFA